MKKSNLVFQRMEEKYLLDIGTAQRFYRCLEDRMKADRYGPSTVFNLYYDTPDDVLIRQSLEKPVYKEKLRLRSYGEADRSSTVFFELKKKYNGVVFKRRAQMTMAQAQRLTQSDCTNQIQKELAWALTHYDGLAPRMQLSYDRLALVGAYDDSLRITFDADIRWRTHQLDLTRPELSKKLAKDDRLIMEIKAQGAMPVWLGLILSELEIYPVSFSKYGRCYETSRGREMIPIGGYSHAG